MQLTIMGRQINVKNASEKELVALSKDNNCIGFFDVNTLTIRLLDSLDKETSKRVLIHELVHVVLTLSGLTNLLSSKQEEAVCDAMENLDAYIQL